MELEPRWQDEFTKFITCLIDTQQITIDEFKLANQLPQEIKEEIEGLAANEKLHKLKQIIGSGEKGSFFVKPFHLILKQSIIQEETIVGRMVYFLIQSLSMMYLN